MKTKTTTQEISDITFLMLYDRKNTLSENNNSKTLLKLISEQKKYLDDLAQKLFGTGNRNSINALRQARTAEFTAAENLIKKSLSKNANVFDNTGKMLKSSDEVIDAIIIGNISKENVLQLQKGLLKSGSATGNLRTTLIDSGVKQAIKRGEYIGKTEKEIEKILRNKGYDSAIAKEIAPKIFQGVQKSSTLSRNVRGTSTALNNNVVNILGTGWKTMNRSKAIAALLAAGAGVAAIMYFLRNEANPLPDCVINKLTEAELNSVGTSVTFKKTGVKGLDAQGGIILKDDGTCITGNGRYKGTYSCSGNNILVKIGNNEYLIPGGLGTSTTPPKKDDNKKTSTYSRTTADLQQKLYNLGFYIGNTGPAGNGVDGYYGPKTKLAETSWKNGDTCSTFNQRNNYPNPETCKSGTATTGGGTATTGGGTATTGGGTATTGNREIVTTNPNED